MNSACCNDDSTDGHNLLTPSPLCCCASLSLTPTLSPWDVNPNINTKTLKRLKAFSEYNLEHCRKVLDGSNIITIEKTLTSSSKQASFTSRSSDSKNLLANSRPLLNYEIPYNFEHQCSPNRAIKDYRRTHTYPTMQKRVMSAYSAERHSKSRRHSRNYVHIATTSMPHITATLRPKMILLGEYYDGSGHRKKLRKEDLDNAQPTATPLPPPPPPPLRKIISHSFSKRAMNKLTRPVEYELPFKMRLVNHPVPSFLIKPSKSVNKSHSKADESTSSSAKAKKGNVTKHNEKSRDKAVCNIIPPEGTELRTHVPNARMQSFTYNYMNYCQQKTQQEQTREDSNNVTMSTATAQPRDIGVNKPKVCSNSPTVGSNSPGSVMTITSPWGDHC